MKNIFLAIALLSAPASAATAKHGVAIPTNVAFSAIPVCYDFGCATRASVSLPLTEWQSVAGWFDKVAPTAAAERQQIRQAVGWMEVLIGRHTPTHIDREFDLAHHAKRASGQLDCIDESVNTTIYLRLFEGNGFLRHHVVIEEAYRRAIFDQHWAGQIREIDTGTRYVVDSWFQPNGYLPVIQDSRSWENINLLSAVIDNSPDETDGAVKRSLWHRFLRGE